MSDPVSVRERVREAFWARHANPKSGWSRTLLGPLLVLAVYRRDWRLIGAAVVATVVNPVAFPPPADDPESWMTRAVRAERWWLEAGHGAFGLAWPNVLNTLNLPSFAYTLHAAYRRRPFRAAAGLVVSMALKFAWIGAIARRHAASGERPPRD